MIHQHPGGSQSGQETENLRVLHEKIYCGPNDSKIYAIPNIKIKEVLSLPRSQDSKIGEA